MLCIHKPVIAEINNTAIIHNCCIIRKLMPADCKLCVAVKCNAYGHGTEQTIPAFKKAGVEMLCVATIEEAAGLIKLGWNKPVLLLGSEFSIYSGVQKQKIAEWIVSKNIRVTATGYADDIKSLIKASKTIDRPAIIHLMLDTGMSRMGLSESELNKLIKKVKYDNRLTIEGIYTHFATSDEKDKEYAYLQLSRFKKYLDSINKQDLIIPVVHAANSGAVLDIPESHFNMIRPGISIYGYHPSRQMHNNPDLKPALRLKSFLTLVKKIQQGSCIGYGCTRKADKDMIIGLVPIGYGDGYDRRLSNSGLMSIKDFLVPVIGMISMDQTIVDLTNLVKEGIYVNPGIEVIVIDDKREKPNSVESIASKINTIPNEIVSRLGQRIQRITIQ